MKSKNFLDAKDVMAYTGLSISMAYRLIRELNKELAAQGYITFAGKVSKVYFAEKVYGGML